MRPWVWRSRDDSERVVETVPGGERYYYYEPGSATPFFVQDPDYGYGFEGGALVVVYDRSGHELPSDEIARRADWAGRYLARARQLYAASRQAQRAAVAEANWAAQRDAIDAQREDWRRQQDQDPDWRAYHDQYGGAEQAHFEAERLQRLAWAAQVDQSMNDQAHAERDRQEAQREAEASGHSPEAAAGGPPDGFFAQHPTSSPPPAVAPPTPPPPPPPAHKPAQTPPNGFVAAPRRGPAQPGPERQLAGQHAIQDGQTPRQPGQSHQPFAAAGAAGGPGTETSDQQQAAADLATRQHQAQILDTQRAQAAAQHAQAAALNAQTSAHQAAKAEAASRALSEHKPPAGAPPMSAAGPQPPRAWTPPPHPSTAAPQIAPRPAPPPPPPAPPAPAKVLDLPHAHTPPPSKPDGGKPDGGKPPAASNAIAPSKDH